MNSNTYTLTQEETTYFENNEIACMRAIKERKIFQENGSWFKTTKDILIPKEEQQKNKEDEIRNFDISGFIKEYESHITEDDMVELFGFFMLGDEDPNAMVLKRKSYERAMAVKKRLRK